MNANVTTALPRPAAMRRSWGSRNALPVVIALLVGACAPARAVDGCMVLLCFAAPSWRAIPQCVAPIRQALLDLARGRVFPTCGMSGGASSASHAWASAPGNCPPQYTRSFEGESTTVYQCDYAGVVSVSVEGQPFTRTWWNMAGDSVTEYSAAAKARLGSWDTRFDDDYARWLATVPAPAPTPPAESGS